MNKLFTRPAAAAATLERTCCPTPSPLGGAILIRCLTSPSRRRTTNHQQRFQFTTQTSGTTLVLQLAHKRVPTGT